MTNTKKYYETRLLIANIKNGFEAENLEYKLYCRQEYKIIFFGKLLQEFKKS